MCNGEENIISKEKSRNRRIESERIRKKTRIMNEMMHKKKIHITRFKNNHNHSDKIL